MEWFDAHLDLAYLAVRGRDMHAPLDPSIGPHPPGAVTLGSLREGGIVACLGTVFTESTSLERAGDEPGVTYARGDATGAAAAGRSQIEVYAEWERRGWITRLGAREASLRVGVLVEGADPIRGPEELAWWQERGVVAVGLTWARGSRFAAGNAGLADTGERALTDAGRELVVALDEMGLVHDLSHLSRRGADDLLARSSGRVMASHSNVASLVDPANERHLTDAQVVEIARRDGVIGLNLFSAFLEEGIEPGGSRRARLSACVAHVERIAELTGGRRHVGLGSDMDGGFSAARLPEGISEPRDLGRLLEGLRGAGWADADLSAFSWGNWARFWNLV